MSAVPFYSGWIHSPRQLSFSARLHSWNKRQNILFQNRGTSWKQTHEEKHRLPFSLLHLLLLLEQLGLQLLLVADQVLNLLLQLILQLPDQVVNIAAVVLVVLEDLQLGVKHFILILQMLHLEGEMRHMKKKNKYSKMETLKVFLTHCSSVPDHDSCS